MYRVRGTFCISSVQFDILFRYQIKIASKRILKRMLKQMLKRKQPIEEEEPGPKRSRKEDNIVSAKR